MSKLLLILVFGLNVGAAFGYAIKGDLFGSFPAGAAGAMLLAVILKDKTFD